MNHVTRQKLSALHSLVDHPMTPENERKSARARIGEIEEKVRAEESKKRTGVRIEDHVSRRGIAAFKNRIRSAENEWEEISHDDWPFGWDGSRELDEYESGYGFNGEYVIGWKCPDCGDHVTRIIDGRMMLRFAANPDARQEYIDRIISAETNHLCVVCWRKWNEK